MVQMVGREEVAMMKDEARFCSVIKVNIFHVQAKNITSRVQGFYPMRDNVVLGAAERPGEPRSGLEH